MHVLAYTAVETLKPECGDGTVQASEECDDGNLRSGDGCTKQCKLEPVCGNGKIEAEEKCDDGNTLDGDGCNAQCELEVDLREIDLAPEPEPEPEIPGSRTSTDKAAIHPVERSLIITE